MCILCIPMYTGIYHIYCCIPLYTHVYCIAFTLVYPCILVYTYVRILVYTSTDRYVLILLQNVIMLYCLHTYLYTDIHIRYLRMVLNHANISQSFDKIKQVFNLYSWLSSLFRTIKIYHA